MQGHCKTQTHLITCRRKPKEAEAEEEEEEEEEEKEEEEEEEEEEVVINHVNINQCLLCQSL
jgi:hypothetical protein